MIPDAASADCLRARLLRYFGETPPDRCGACGNCQKPRERVDASDFARTVFGLIRDTGGGYGLRTLTAALMGRKRVSARKLSDAAGFASYSGWLQDDIDQRLNTLADEGYLVCETQPYFSVRLTDRAKAVLSGEPCWLELPIPPAEPAIPSTPQSRSSSLAAAPAVRARSAKPSSDKNAPIDPYLFERLKTLRLAISKAQGVPPYVVFSNATLEDMCRKRPQTLTAMLGVTGVGEHKARAYGARFLEALRE
jgi:ATP-dependent DNA helicase RecQ